jgi:hypothetical protein
MGNPVGRRGSEVSQMKLKDYQKCQECNKGRVFTVPLAQNSIVIF